MNDRLVTAFLAAAVLTSGICLAQPETTAGASDFKPATSNQPGREYPQVSSEGRVRARVVAPDAHTVLLDIGAVKYPMAKGTDGAWIGDSNPQDEGFHYYQLVIGIGAWLGTIMLFNVWVLIWPNQKKILGIVAATDEEKAAARKTAMLASRTNFVLSIPMLLCMGSATHGLPF